ncbi:alpha/beta hydrolase [Rudaeicoccus suwonensis]|uniref:Alpha/beta hydrolase family protein n=1 Tax=Rudaeicoccus suwonensis TaxID=657409 RepID=A0A561E777_9MICO|nr:alpha/beta hydrolase [Rudaeicoccus suwonensis]TWE11454.1 alpha/beta hydrolase family protein [Rudaeicoccus suwonensis]
MRLEVQPRRNILTQLIEGLLLERGFVVRSFTVQLTPPTHHFVESYPDLVYTQFEGDHLLSGGQQLHFDFLKPVTKTPTPLVVFVKGGGFRNVHRARYLPALVPLAQRGIAIASVEYRTSNLVKFPQPVEDVREALRYIRAHAIEFNIDPTNVGMWGNSAGATIVTIAGASADEGAEPIRAVASWYGIHDPLRSSKFRASGSPMRATLGPPDDEGGHWYKPSDCIGPQSPPMFLVHGTDDQVVPMEQSVALAETLDEVGVPYELMLIEGGRHDFAQTSTCTDALQHTLDFLYNHLIKSDDSHNS